MSFQDYEDFKQDCFVRKATIDQKPDEYIDYVDYRDDGALLITLLSRSDPFAQRTIWSYNATNIVPELDFENFAYFMDTNLRYEFKKYLQSEADLLYHTYKSNSANYLLLNPSEKLESKNEKLSLIASDDDNGVQVTFNVLFKDQFFETKIETDKVEF
jgi:hypothetical protein